MRLIDADKLPKYDGYALSADMVAVAVENAPTVELVERYAGHWIECTYCEPDGHGFVDHYHKAGICCSECRHVYRKKYMWDRNFCPNCGADMREDGDT